jgi:Protein of unknown function (DUF1353)
MRLLRRLTSAETTHISSERQAVDRLEFPEWRQKPGFYMAGTESPARWLYRRETTRGAGRKYLLQSQIDLVRKTETIRVPGKVPDAQHPFETDLASVPFVVGWLIPTDGIATEPAVFHDAMIGGTNGVDYLWTGTGDIPAFQADRIFREELQRAGVWRIRTWLMWSAVALRTLIKPRNQSKPARVRAAALALMLSAAGLVATREWLILLGFRNRRWLHPDSWAWHTSVLSAIAVIAVSAVMTGLLLTVLFPQRGRRPLAAGLIAGGATTVIFLPTALVTLTWAAYHLLDWVATTRKVSPAGTDVDVSVWVPTAPGSAPSGPPRLEHGRS